MKDGVVIWESNVGSGVITIGNNMIVGGKDAGSITTDKDLWKHEYNHSVQWAGLGVFGFGVTWLGGLANSAIYGQMGPGPGGCMNLIEWSAGSHGTSYSGKCAW